MKETNGRILEVFEGDCFMFKADELLAPDLLEAQERYGIYIDDAFFTLLFYGGNGNHEEKQVLLYTGFFGGKMYLQFMQPLDKEFTRENIVDLIVHVLGFGVDDDKRWFTEAIEERVNESLKNNSTK